MLPYIAVVLAVFVKGKQEQLSNFRRDPMSLPFSAGSDQCIHGGVRFVNGITLQEGRLEICINTTWSTVCSNKWGAADAKVVCRQLGYKENG